MARPGTVRRVHEAVLDLARRGGPTALTMEGIAAAAGVGKQTLYRTWPTVHAVLFDALAADDGPGAAEDVTVVELLRGAVEEISTEPHASLLRVLAASIQTDEAVAREFRQRLLLPQLDQVRAVVAAAGSTDPERDTELLLSPIFYRWFMRLPAHDDRELAAHVRGVLGAEPG